MDPVICPMPSEGTTQEPSQCLPCSHPGSWTKKKEDSVLEGWVLENRGQKETMAAEQFFLCPLGLRWKFWVSHLGVPLGKWLLAL